MERLGASTYPGLISIRIGMWDEVGKMDGYRLGLWIQIGTHARFHVEIISALVVMRARDWRWSVIGVGEAYILNLYKLTWD